jgi:hypothetical protein
MLKVVGLRTGKGFVVPQKVERPHDEECAVMLVDYFMLNHLGVRGRLTMLREVGSEDRFLT